jgi:hypothetical protein
MATAHALDRLRQLFGGEPAGEGLTTERDLLADAVGYAYGAAALVEKKTDLMRVSLQYEYSVARQRIPNRFDGAFLSTSWNVPHRISGGVDLVLTDHLTMLGRLEYEIGRVWAFRDAYYNYLEPDPDQTLALPFDLSDPESHRLPPVIRLDLGFAYRAALKNTALQVRLHLQNLLSVYNVEEWNLLYNEATGRYRKIERPLSPFLPSLVVRLAF